MVKNNRPASEYAPPHTMSGKPVKGDEAFYATDPNTLKANEFTPGGQPIPRVSLGNITDGPKTSGIKMRGAGAAERGFMSRGPMA